MARSPLLLPEAMDVATSTEAAHATTVSRRDFLVATSALVAGSFLPTFGTAWAAEPDAGSALQAQRLAWAGVRLQLGKDNLFIDPLTNPDVWGAALKDSFIPVDGGEGAHYVLVTHRHPDHFDPETIKKALGDSGILVCEPDVAALATAAGFKTRVAPLYEPILLNDFTVTAVPASDGYGDPQVSWVVSGGGRRIIHCGDTLWHGAWWRIGRQLGPFDAAFLPINGARFAWRKPVSDIPAVLTPEQAVAAAVVIGARLVVPIHYGMVGAESYTEVADPEKLLLAAARKRNVDVEILHPGQWLTWQSRQLK